MGILKKILVTHIPSQKNYEAWLIDDRPDGSVIFNPIFKNEESFLKPDSELPDTLHDKEWKFVKNL